MEAAVLPVRSDDTVAGYLRAHLAAVALSVAAFLLLFATTLRDLAFAWYRDGEISHGFLVVAGSAAIVFARRRAIGAAPARISFLGLSVLLAGLVLHFFGRARFTDFATSFGLWAAVLGSAWFVLGARAIGACPFPFFFLAFAVPPPNSILGPMRLGLRTIATRMSADILGSIGIEAVQSGNVLFAGDRELEVADACSGIRSLLVIVASAILFAWLFRAGWSRGAMLALAAIPITVAVNILRIVFLAVALVRFRTDMTEGAVHEAVSIAAFAASLGLLYACLRFLRWLVPARKEARA